ncbi:hypothetical protein C8J57DRAFT_1727453, partial [Mycena rebaudengoi]
MSLPNSVLAWPHPLMITAAVVAVRATTAPRMTKYHLKAHASNGLQSLFSRLCSTMTTTRNSASTVMTTSARASCVSSWIFSPAISRHFVAASGLRVRSWMATATATIIKAVIIEAATTNAKTQTS